MAVGFCAIFWAEKTSPKLLWGPSLLDGWSSAAADLTMARFFRALHFVSGPARRAVGCPTMLKVKCENRGIQRERLKGTGVRLHDVIRMFAAWLSRTRCSQRTISKHSTNAAFRVSCPFSRYPGAGRASASCERRLMSLRLRSSPETPNTPNVFACPRVPPGELGIRTRKSRGSRRRRHSSYTSRPHELRDDLCLLLARWSLYILVTLGAVLWCSVVRSSLRKHRFPYHRHRVAATLVYVIPSLIFAAFMFGMDTRLATTYRASFTSPRLYEFV